MASFPFSSVFRFESNLAINETFKEYMKSDRCSWSQLSLRVEFSDSGYSCKAWSSLFGLFLWADSLLQALIGNIRKLLALITSLGKVFEVSILRLLYPRRAPYHNIRPLPNNFLRKMKRKILYYIGGTGIVLIILGAVLQCVVPGIVKSKVEDIIALRPGTEAYERWERLPVPLLFNVTFFEVVNYENVSQGQVPLLKERGPFVYVEKRDKVEIQVTEEEDRGIYYQRSTYEFSEELSAESDETELICINPPAVLFAQIAESLPGLRSVLSLFNVVLFKMWPGNPIFVKVKVRDFLFDGIKMSCHANSSSPMENLIWKALCLAYKYIRPEKLVEVDDGEPGLNTFAMFKNRKKGLEGPFEVKLGITEPKNVGQIIAWRESSRLNIWGGDTCNTISGTDSTIFRPHLHDVDTVTIFHPDVCRSINLTYVGPEKFKGVPVRRYVAGEELFGVVKDRPENYCYCPRSVKGLTSYGGCLKTGLLDLSPCQGAPVTASYPHFLMADPSYAGSVEGLEPNIVSHQTFADLEPHTGYPMRGAARIQINVFLKKIVEVEAMKKLPGSVVPLLWIEEGVELSDELVDEVKSRLLNIILIADIVSYVLIAFGLILVIYFVLALIIKIKSK